MTRPDVTNQAVVAHFFAPLDGSVSAADDLVRERWTECQQAFGATAPIPSTSLPTRIPQTLPRPAVTGSALVAAAQRPDRTAQLILRIEHDVLALSIMVTGATGRWEHTDPTLFTPADDQPLLGSALFLIGNSEEPFARPALPAWAGSSDWRDSSLMRLTRPVGAGSAGRRTVAPAVRRALGSSGRLDARQLDVVARRTSGDAASRAVPHARGQDPLRAAGLVGIPGHRRAVRQPLRRRRGVDASGERCQSDAPHSRHRHDQREIRAGARPHRHRCGGSAGRRPGARGVVPAAARRRHRLPGHVPGRRAEPRHGALRGRGGSSRQAGPSARRGRRVVLEPGRAQRVQPPSVHRRRPGRRRGDVPAAHRVRRGT